MKMNKINIALLAAVLLIVCVVPPGLAQDAIGPLLENDLQLNTMQGVTGRVRVAFDGTRYLAVWSQAGDPADPSNTTPGIWGQFLTADGAKDGAAFPIFAFPALPEINPAIAWNGSYYLVVWRNASEIQGQAINPDGSAYGAHVMISKDGNDTEEDPAVASNGADFLVVYQANNGLHTIKAAILTELIPGFLYSVSQFALDPNWGDPAHGHDACVNPTISFGNGSYFVTWSYAPDELAPTFDLRGVFVTTDPDDWHYWVVGAAFNIATGTGNQGGAIPAGNVFDGTNFIVTYGDDDGTTSKVKAVTVSPDGVVGVPLEIADAPGLSGTDIALGPYEWFVVWGADGLAKGARVQDDVVVDSGGVNLSAVEAPGAQPSVLFAGGNYLVFFEGFSSFDKYAQLVGYGLPPEEQIANILEFFDDSVESGTLVGAGSGASADHRLDAVMHMIETAGALIEEGDIDGACNQLMAAYGKTDGDPIPPDFVTGSAASDLAFMIDELRQSLGCE